MPYKTQSPDTSPEMEKVYFDLLRKKPRTERLRLAYDFIDETVVRSRRKIAALNPTWSEQEVNLYWVRLMYGNELADRLASYLKQHDR